MRGYENRRIPLNPILARKDFLSKGLARYKKCQQRRNIYTSRSSAWGDASGRGIAGRHRQSRVFGIWHDSRRFGYQRAVALLGCPPSANMFFIAAGEK